MKMAHGRTLLDLSYYIRNSLSQKTVLIFVLRLFDNTLGERVLEEILYSFMIMRLFDWRWCSTLIAW